MVKKAVPDAWVAMPSKRGCGSGSAGKGFLFAERGEVALRGFEEPLRLYEVRWSPHGEGQA